MRYDGKLFHYCRLKKCEHLTHYVVPDDQGNILDGPSYPACHAYPKGIPYEIRKGIDRHHEVRDDQEGDWTYTRRSQKKVDESDMNVVELPPEEITATTREV